MEKLASNEKMISWLNRQLTTAQLQAANMTRLTTEKAQDDRTSGVSSAAGRWQQPPFKYSDAEQVLAPHTPAASKFPITAESSKLSVFPCQDGLRSSIVSSSSPRPWLDVGPAWPEEGKTGASTVRTGTEP